MKHLIVAETPNAHGEMLATLGVARLIGVEADVVRKTFDRADVFPRWFWSNKTGDWWDPTEGRKIIRILRKRGFFGSVEYPRKRVILLGTRVMRAFDLDAAYFVSTMIKDVEYVVAPQFVGQEGWWTNSHNYQVAKMLWLKWIREAGESRWKTQ